MGEASRIAPASAYRERKGMPFSKDNAAHFGRIGGQRRKDRARTRQLGLLLLRPDGKSWPISDWDALILYRAFRLLSSEHQRAINDYLGPQVGTITRSAIFKSVPQNQLHRVSRRDHPTLWYALKSFRIMAKEIYPREWSRLHKKRARETMMAGL